MKDKILILGASGMLGWQVTKFFYKKKTNLTVTVSNSNSAIYLKKKIDQKLNIIQFDFLKNKKEELKKIVLKHDVVINCIGLIKPYIKDQNPKDVEKAIKLNSMLPNLLDQIVKKSKIKIYQIATDCVFSGNSKEYNEDSKHDCDDVYGKTKSLGEINSKNYFNLRCSIIGEEIKSHKSLISWFISNKKGSSLNGFVNHEWNGITTNAFSKIIYTIIKSKVKLPNMFHIVPKNKVSKYNLLKILNKKFKKNFKIKKFKSKVSINRTLKTKHNKLNSLIWKKTEFKKIPAIERMILDI